MEEKYKVFLNRIYSILGKPVPDEVIRRCKSIQSFVWVANNNSWEHDLNSSQVVSMIVEQYERENS